MHLALLGWLGCEDQGLVQLDPPIPTTTTTTPPTGTDVPTWQDVAPILEARCLQCHLGEGPAPMSLETYASARAWAPSIAVAVRERTMPPYLVDAGGDCQEFVDPGWLSEEEITTLEAWAEAGAPSGPSVEPLVGSPLARMDDPDVMLDIGVDFLPNESPDQYRCFITDPGLVTDRYLTGYDVFPGNPEIVHHVTLFTLDTPAAIRQAEALDAEDPVPGYACFGGAGVLQSRQITGWALGTPETWFPEGTGLLLYAGSRVVVEVHYHTHDGAEPDRSQVALALEDTVETEAEVVMFYDLSMSLAPGEADLPYSFAMDTQGLVGEPVPLTVWGVFPHMHERGRSIRLDDTRDGATTCLADVPRWDFNWQRSYFYREPIQLEPTDELRVSCRYDTSGDTEPVPFGESTEDEMCVFGALVTR
ncbi:MAG: monooxygenase [Myxococcales bacterium]|nr:monooxygenase [Myxococcales bacterium]